MLFIAKNKLWSYLLVVLYGAVILFQGCTKHENFYKTDKITKVGNIHLEDGYTILTTFYPTNRRFGISDLKGYFKDRKLTDDLTVEEIENEYFIRFSFNRELIKSPVAMVLEPCDMTVEHDSAFSYPAHATPLGGNEENLDVVFRIENLIQLNYISLDRDNQKALCLFRKNLLVRTNGPLKVAHDYIASNKLIYSVEEINTIVDEYKEITQ